MLFQEPIAGSCVRSSKFALFIANIRGSTVRRERGRPDAKGKIYVFTEFRERPAASQTLHDLRSDHRAEKLCQPNIGEF